MSVNGVWKLEIKNPFSTRKATLYISIMGDRVSGKMEQRKSTSDITDARIDGNTLMWKASRKPKFLTFEFTAKVDGDAMSGTVKSRLGKASLKGTRISHETTR
jgi:hypothetical protein